MKTLKLIGIVVLVAAFGGSCASKRAKVKEDSASAQVGQLIITKVELIDDTQETRVAIDANREPKYNVFKLADPERVVVDLIDAKLGDGIPAVMPGAALVKEVRVQALEDSLSSLVRLEIFMSGAANYLAGLEEKGLSIRLIRSSEVPAPEMAEAAPSVTLPAPVPVPEATAEAVPPPPLPEMKAEVAPKADEVAPKAEEIPPMPAPEMKAEVVPPMPEAPLPAPAPESAEKLADAKPSPEVAAAAPEVVAPIPLPMNDDEEKVEEAPKKAKKVELKKDSTIEIPSANVTEGTSLLSELDTKIYTGKRVSLEFQDADVQDIIRLIAEVSKLNIITSDDVKGKLTLKLIDVPWDQALDIILTTLGLDKVQHGNILRVAPAEKLKKEREIALANDKAAKQLEPLKLKLINTNYATPDEMSSRIKNMLSERGTVDTDSRTNTLIVKDIKENLNRIESLIKALDTQTPQVRIESRIVQANDTFARNLGVQWGPTLKLDTENNKQLGVTFPRTINVGTTDANASTTAFKAPTPSQLSQFAVDAIGGTSGYGGALGFRLGSVSSIFNLDLRLSYAESENLAHIVSRPSISVLNNRTARIIQGTKIPFLSSSQNGANVQFQEAGIEISVTPQVTSDGAVMLKVATKSNEPGSQAVGGNPQILIREANTEMLVKSARTAVLGGVFKTTDRRSTGGVPGLMNIPVLGWLFKGQSTGAEREETLIFVTPYILSDARTPQTSTSGAAELEP